MKVSAQNFGFLIVYMHSKYAAQLILLDFATASSFGNDARKIVPQNILEWVPERTRRKGRAKEREVVDVRRCTRNCGSSRRGH